MQRRTNKDKMKELSSNKHVTSTCFCRLCLAREQMNTHLSTCSLVVVFISIFTPKVSLSDFEQQQVDPIICSYAMVSISAITRRLLMPFGHWVIALTVSLMALKSFIECRYVWFARMLRLLFPRGLITQHNITSWPCLLFKGRNQIPE